MTKEAEYEVAYAAAMRADDAFQAALDEQYGVRATEARYDSRLNRAILTLRAATDAYRTAMDALRTAWRQSALPLQEHPMDEIQQLRDERDALRAALQDLLEAYNKPIRDHEEGEAHSGTVEAIEDEVRILLSRTQMRHNR